VVKRWKTDRATGSAPGQDAPTANSSLVFLKGKINEQVRTLRRFFIAGLFFLVVCQAVANYLIIEHLIVPANHRVELNLAHRAMDGILVGLEREERSLRLTAVALASGRDAYLFVSSATPGYIEARHDAHVFLDNRLNMIGYFDRSGREVWRKTVRIGDSREMRTERMAPVDLVLDHTWWQGDPQDQVRSGMIPLQETVLVVATCPIRSPDSRKEIAGRLVVGRFLNLEVWNRATGKIATRLKIVPYSMLHPPVYDDRLASDLLLAGSYIHRAGRNSIRVYSLVPDYRGRPEIVLEAEVKRSVSLQSGTFLRYVFTANLVVGIVVFFLGFLFHKRIVHYLANITQLSLVLARSGSSMEDEVGLLPTDMGLMCGENLGEDDYRHLLPPPDQKSKDGGNLWEVSVWLAREVEQRGRAAASLRAISRRLEKLVQDRTLELREINRQLTDEIRERQQYAKKLEKYQQRLRSISSEMMAMEERQRRQIAIDLHDRIGQSLSVSRMALDSILEAEDIAEVRRQVVRVSDILEQTLQDTRTLTFELCPPVLHELGLGAALEWLSEVMAERYSLDVEVQCPPILPVMNSPLLSLVFRSTRELLMNVVRHARTDRARVDVWREEDGLRIRVQDWGEGMAKDVMEIDSHGFGLFSIQERVINLGGSMEIDSAPGRGTTITLVVPVSNWQEENDKEVA